MRPIRLVSDDLARHLIDEPVGVRALREAALAAAPKASEAIKFRALCHYPGDAFFKSIGGNICMIEVKDGQVRLSLILGAKVADPDGLLFGSGKCKRFLGVPIVAFAKREYVASLVRAASRMDSFDDFAAVGAEFKRRAATLRA